jgi:hypothetical protein
MVDIQDRRRPVADLLEGGGATAGEPPAPVAIAGVPPAAGAAQRVRNYDELEGQEGRGVFFRPHRYTAADLAPLQGTVTVELAGEEHACALRDVSQNGVAFAWPAGVPVQGRERLRVALRFDAHEAFRGEALVGSVREGEEGTIVGISFHEFLLDVDELMQLRQIRAWRAAAPARGGLSWAWRTNGSERFKSLVAELRLFMEDAQAHLAEVEKALPWHVLQGEANPARTALVASLREEFAAPVVAHCEQIDAVVRELPDGYAHARAKEWSVRHLDRFLLTTPSCVRAKYKPFGYPGDYEVMNFMYERHFEGSTLFGRAMGLGFMEMRAARAVRARKDLVKRELKALLARRAGESRPVRVLSIAAGPAQEIFELLQELDELPVDLEVVLFEQDKNALAHAWRRLKPCVEARFRHCVRLTFLHDSVKRLLRDATLFAPFGHFDLTYSCGLFDYFQTTTAVVLTRRLAATTAPGGQLLVANMVDHPTRWIMEHHLDWNLIYRTRDEMLELGRRAAPGAGLRILEEESGVNPFVEVVRA